MFLVTAEIGGLIDGMLTLYACLEMHVCVRVCLEVPRRKEKKSPQRLYLIAISFPYQYFPLLILFFFSHILQTCSP